MMNTTLMNRSGLAAIAAATAFLSTPLLAQDATPVAADPPPIVADTPLPSEPAASPAASTDTLAPVPTTTTAKTKTTTRTVRSVRTATAPVKVAPRAAAAPVAAATVATPSTAAAPVETPADPALVAPLPEAPVAATPVEQPAAVNDDLLPIAEAAGLGLLALAGAGSAMRRRRRDEEETVVTDEWTEPAMTRPVEAAPMAQPSPIVTASPMAAPVAASAFRWGGTQRTAEPAERISRIEAAKRGPTPDNPSHSLKKRLARAAFFDQRERAVAAGQAVPVDAMAGLPDALDTSEMEPRVRTPRPIPGMTFNRRFQPA